MATLMVAGVGAMIGATWGGALGITAWTGFQAGVIAGGIIDALFDPFGLRSGVENQYNGKIQTDIISTSSYGIAIPELFGTHKLNGNMIWGKDLLEAVTEESYDSGGMSAGQASSIFTYTYYGNFSYAFCSGAIIEKIWCDEKLCWVRNNTSTPEIEYSGQLSYIIEGAYGPNPDPTLAKFGFPAEVDLSGYIVGEIIYVYGFSTPINGWYTVHSVQEQTLTVYAWSEYNTLLLTATGYVTTTRNANTNPVDWPGGCVDFERYFTIYDGNYTQDPDPYIQAFEGAANTPAERGLTHIPFHVLPLLNFGNRIPNVTVLASRSKTLGESILAICERVGLDSSYVDLTLLDNVDVSVTGFKVMGNMSARAMLEKLAIVYRFDISESGGKIRFVSFKTTPDITIEYEDMGCGLDEAAKPLRETRAEPWELPRQINLNYFDPSNSMNYQNATIIVRRENSKSSNIVDLQTDNVMTQDFAGKLAKAEMRRRWVERDSFELTLPLKYLALEPSDVIALPTEFGSQELKITKIDLSPQGLLSISGRKSFQETIPNSPTPPDPGGWTPELPSSTVYAAVFFPLDLPLLFNNDDENGFYAVSFFPPSDGQVGIYTSQNNDSYSLYGKINRGSITGKIVSGELLASVHPEIWDDASQITIELSYSGHELSSKTDAQVLNGENSVLIGDEIVQFVNVELQSDGRYILSRFLRGRKGTEHNMVGQTTNTRFIMLSSDRYYRFSQDYSLLNVPIYYKALGAGEASLGGKPIMLFANTGIAWKCYSVAHLQSTKESNGDFYFSWVRRARKNAGWNSYEDVPLDETSESYEIDIYDSPASSQNLIATKTVSNPYYTYTLANQITDFGSAPTENFEIIVYQIGKTGRGYPTSLEVAV